MARQSLASGSIILPLDAALQAIDHMARAGRRVQTWEGWVKLPDGGRARSLAHAGSFALPREVDRAATTTRDGLQRAQARWDRDPEYPNAKLYFALAFEPVT